MLTQQVNIENFLKPIIVIAKIINAHGVDESVYINPSSLKLKNLTNDLPEHPGPCRLEINGEVIFQGDAQTTYIKNIRKTVCKNPFINNVINIPYLLTQAQITGEYISIEIDTTTKGEVNITAELKTVL